MILIFSVEMSILKRFCLEEIEMSLQFKMKLNSNYFRWVTRLAGWQPAAGKRSSSSSLFILICVLVIIVLVLNPICARYGVTLKQLRELMESRGYDGVQKVIFNSHNVYHPLVNS